MLVMIPPKVSVSSFMGTLKGKSASLLYTRYPEFFVAGQPRNFWARGYFVSTVGVDDDVVQNYIRNQYQEDKVSDPV
jgi:putative transposase